MSIPKYTTSNNCRLTSAAPTITIRQASLSYVKTRIFDKLNFTLLGGLCTCLLGPSGVGKTSLLRLIAGLATNHPIIEAEVVAADDGQPIAGRVAYMAQNDLLLPWLTILDNVLIGSRLRGDSNKIARRQQATELLKQVGLSAVKDQFPVQLSGGMRQRVALVRTLLEERPIVLMDEPFAALDAITRLQLQQYMAELLIGRTVLVVTHDPLEALRLGHRIHVMAGVPAQLDTALEPPGLPPRPLTESALLQLQAELYDRLQQAQQASVGQ